MAHMTYPPDGSPSGFRVCLASPLQSHPPCPCPQSTWAKWTHRCDFPVSSVMEPVSISDDVFMFIFCKNERALMGRAVAPVSGFCVRSRLLVRVPTSKRMSHVSHRYPYSCMRTHLPASDPIALFLLPSFSGGHHPAGDSCAPPASWASVPLDFGIPSPGITILAGVSAS